MSDQLSNLGHSTSGREYPSGVSESCTCIYQQGWSPTAPTLNKITVPSCPIHGAEMGSDPSGHKNASEAER